MKKAFPSLALIVATFLATVPARAQEEQATAAKSSKPAPCEGARMLVPDLFSVRWELMDMLKLTGAAPAGPVFLERPSSLSRLPVCAAKAPAATAWAVSPTDTTQPSQWGIWPVTGEVLRNSGYPKDENNGAMWAGVGANLAATAGVWGRWHWLSAAIAPRLIWQQNAAFPLVPVEAGWSSVSNPYHLGELDWPQRMGTSSFGTFDPGQSYVRADVGYFSAGVSTENMTLGPSRIYPILMSSTAPGFPHVFLGSSRPIPTPIGLIDVQTFFGELTKSAYDPPDAAHRVINGLVVGWSPRWIPGLQLGAARLYIEALADSTSFGRILRSFINISPTFVGGGNQVGNGLGALYGRWVLPSSGFEVYGEWTREDTPYNLQDLLAEPDWSQAYGLGFQPIAQLGDGTKQLHLRGELVHLGAPAPIRAGKGFLSYYVHGGGESVTNDGQLLGAAIGPGSDAQVLGLDLLYGHALTGLWAERARYDDDTYYMLYARRYAESRHDYELTGGLRHVFARGPLQLEGKLAYSRRYNRMFLDLQTLSDTPASVDSNLQLDLRASWFPGTARSAGVAQR